MSGQVEALVLSLQRRTISDSYTAAQLTAAILRTVVEEHEWRTSQALLEAVREVGSRLAHANRLEFAVGNVVRRVLFIIRDETLSNHNMENGGGDREDGNGSAPSAPNSARKSPVLDFYSLGGSSSSLQIPVGSMSPSVTPRSISTDDLSPALHHMIMGKSSSQEAIVSNSNIVEDVVEGIDELIKEMEVARRNIEDQSLEHIHAKEVIMTYGRSKVVEGFLKNAARKRKFSVIVAETSPTMEGQELAVELAKAGIETTLITDSAIFAMMARVNKVIVGCHAILANGGLISLVGGRLLAHAARHYSVPYVVLAGMYKLTPLYPHNEDALNVLGSPESVLKFEEADNVEDVTVLNPVFDYVPPELVDLFISNIGGHNPSYVYRLLKEYYTEEDHKL